MIQPVNGHILIEPLPQDSFIASERETYQEIGVVVDFDPNINGVTLYDFGDGVSSTVPDLNVLKKGDRVYFDSWLAAKFPKDKQSFYWLVEWDNVRAIEHVESTLPE